MGFFLDVQGMLHFHELYNFWETLIFYCTALNYSDKN